MATGIQINPLGKRIVQNGAITRCEEGKPCGLCKADCGCAILPDALTVEFLDVPGGDFTWSYDSVLLQIREVELTEAGSGDAGAIGFVGWTGHVAKDFLNGTFCCVYVGNCTYVGHFPDVTTLTCDPDPDNPLAGETFDVQADLIVKVQVFSPGTGGSVQVIVSATLYGHIGPAISGSPTAFWGPVAIAVFNGSVDAAGVAPVDCSNLTAGTSFNNGSGGEVDGIIQDGHGRALVYAGECDELFSCLDVDCGAFHLKFTPVPGFHHPVFEGDVIWSNTQSGLDEPFGLYYGVLDTGIPGLFGGEGNTIVNMYCLPCRDIVILCGSDDDNELHDLAYFGRSSSFGEDRHNCLRGGEGSFASWIPVGGGSLSSAAFTLEVT